MVAIENNTFWSKSWIAKCGFAFIFLFTYLNPSAYAQLGFEYDGSIPVIKAGNALSNPWAGGLDYVQLSMIDYNFDGHDDLFVFDRSRNNIRLFEYVEVGGVPSWRFVYNAKSFFPNDLIYRATMVDYDGDGRNDIFCYGVGGLKVYRNIGTQATGLQWELKKSIVNSNYNGFTTNLFVA